MRPASGAGVLLARRQRHPWQRISAACHNHGYPVGPGGSNFPAFETAAQPGTGTWVAPAVDPNLSQGVSMVAVINDGTHNIFVGAMWNSGIWRYIEP